MIKRFARGTFTEEKSAAPRGASPEVVKEVSAIIASVRKWGDESLREYARRFDGVIPDSFEVTEQEIRDAVEALDPGFLQVLEEAAERIRTFHACQVRHGFAETDRNGVLMGSRIVPLDSVGIYVPGGMASYPSTVLMNAIPAALAGVPEIIMATPCAKDGKVAPSLLAAAHIAGVHRIFKTGGAQAIAALAYGTETVPKVDKITGPGNVYVTEAKKQVFGQVGIDMIAGPSEVVIIADEQADAAFVASDMLAQAEHDKDATAILLTDSDALADAVEEELKKQLETLPRTDIARASIEQNGKIILVADLGEAVEIANRLAPEHLEIATARPFDLLNSVRHAGSVFLGLSTPEPVGDYFAGLNHTLPTGGSARYRGALSVDDFVRQMQYCYYSEEALQNDADRIARFAKEEQLDGHARSVLLRTGRDIDA